MQRQVALEAQEEVLAVGVDGRHRPPGEALGPAIRAQARVWGEDLVGLAALEDRPDPARGVVDRVALGHRRPG